MKLKVCPICGATFDASKSHGTQKTCSKECGIKLRALSRNNDAVSAKMRDDLTGRTFGGLTVLYYIDHRKGWMCQCSCGREVTIKGTELKNGTRQDCGHTAWRNAATNIRKGTAGHRDGTNVNTIRNIAAGKRRRTNTTGVTGVKIIQNMAGVVYAASITYQGKYHYLGRFDTLEKARQARKEAEAQYFGQHLTDE